MVIFGLAFKENCPDTRNSKVKDIIIRLGEYSVKPIVIDPWADKKDALREYGVELKEMEEAKEADCIIIAVAHNEFRDMRLDELKGFFKEGEDKEKVLIDVKGLYSVKTLEDSGLK